MSLCCSGWNDGFLQSYHIWSFFHWFTQQYGSSQPPNFGLLLLRLTLKRPEDGRYCSKIDPRLIRRTPKCSRHHQSQTEREQQWQQHDAPLINSSSGRVAIDVLWISVKSWELIPKISQNTNHNHSVANVAKVRSFSCLKKAHCLWWQWCTTWSQPAQTQLEFTQE